MSFSTQSVKYGWLALASLGVITGATIYTLTPTRKQVKPQDIIEIDLATYERCLATQTGTNADGSPIYAVAPTNYIETWKDTNGVSVVVTNTIGWHSSRSYRIAVDAKIKAIVPYYADTNTVYDGTTNIVMLTVTGLWASLQIGDKTNKFTREPAWTNPISTNWIVNYTSYWPSTNGATTNISYTSDYQQVVNYASSWTATGGHVWVTSSNWASEVVTVTNVATYGDYPWQIYVEDLQERYKVLNALKMVNASNYNKTWQVRWADDPVGHSLWGDAQVYMETRFTGPLASSASGTNNWNYKYYDIATPSKITYGVNIEEQFSGGIMSYRMKLFEESLTTNILRTVIYYGRGTMPPYFFETWGTNHYIAFNNNEIGLNTNTYVRWEPNTNGWLGSINIEDIPDWCPEPVENGDSLEGFGSDIFGFIVWQFSYCTNAYWE